MKIEFVGTYEECRIEAEKVFGFTSIPAKVKVKKEKAIEETPAAVEETPAAVEETPTAVEEPPKEAAEATSEPVTMQVEEVPAEVPEALQNEAQPQESAPVITMIEARARMNDLRANHGAAAVRAVLDEIGAKKFTDVPADKYAELMVLVDAAEAGYAAQ